MIFLNKFNFVFFILILSILTSCKKDNQPPMSDGLIACDCAKETSADFRIIESATDDADYGLFITETDTAYANRNIYFIASEKNADYKWYIGTEILTDSMVGRFFPSSVENQTIPITLVVKKKPNTICFPNDDGYDSITKYIHFVKLPDPTGALQPYLFNMAGTYRVKMPHLSDSQDITITSIMDEFNFLPMLGVSNYDGAGNNIDLPTQTNATGLTLYYRNYSEIQLGQEPYSNVGNYFFGRLKRLPNTNKYEFDISLGGINSNYPNYVKRKYIGRKIN